MVPRKARKAKHRLSPERLKTIARKQRVNKLLLTEGLPLCLIPGMAGYSKIFTQILDSTIWREDKDTRLLWITMLVMRDRDHMVKCSIPGLAARANITTEECEAALQKLMSPDKYSQSHELEGRRIQQVEGGWFIINGEKYRNMMNADERREYLRIKQQEFRARRKGMINTVNTVNNESVDVNNSVNNNIHKQKSSARFQTSDSSSSLKRSFDQCIEILRCMGIQGSHIRAICKSEFVTPEEVDKIISEAIEINEPSKFAGAVVNKLRTLAVGPVARPPGTEKPNEPKMRIDN